MSRSLEGSIYRDKSDGRWIARLQYSDPSTGRRRQKIRYCPTQTAAKQKLKELRAEVEDDKIGRKTYRQLDEFFRKEFLHKAKFVGGKKVSGFRQNLKIIENYLDLALNFFGDTPLDEIGYADLHKYKTEIANTLTVHKKQRSVSDVNQNLRRLRRMFNVAIEQEWLSTNPFKRGRSLISESFETERTRILSRAEEQRLLAECTGLRKHLAPIIIFAIETACRRGEMRSLKWSDVNLKGRCIQINGNSTKTLKTRLVPITDRLHNTLTELWKGSTRRQNAYIFGNIDFKKAFNSACTEAKLKDVHFHDLRHTAITRMLEKGISPPLVMKISGHTQQKTFLRYVNQSEASVYEIALQLSKAA